MKVFSNSRSKLRSNLLISILLGVPHTGFGSDNPTSVNANSDTQRTSESTDAKDADGYFTYEAFVAALDKVQVDSSAHSSDITIKNNLYRPGLGFVSSSHCPGTTEFPIIFGVNQIGRGAESTNFRRSVSILGSEEKAITLFVELASAEIGCLRRGIGGQDTTLGSVETSVFNGLDSVVHVIEPTKKGAKTGLVTYKSHWIRKGRAVINVIPKSTEIDVEPLMKEAIALLDSLDG